MEHCWCGNTKLTEYSEGYLVCGACKTLVTKTNIGYNPNAVSDSGPDIYGKQYWEKHMTEKAGVDSLDELIDYYLQERVLYWLKSLLQYRLPSDGAVAEVGCGLGQFSYMLKQTGFEQLAFELSPSICRYIEDTLHINVHCGGFYTNKNHYSAILAFDLIEHITAPEELLTSFSLSLKDDGILILQTPCYDSSLSYEEMLSEKSRFKNLLLENEHVYLYSRESMAALLKSHGFEYIEFLPAFFGDDYDMFLVASRKPLKKKSQADISEMLNQSENGRMIKTLFHLAESRTRNEKTISSIEKDRTDRLRQINQLTALLKESEEDRQSRFEQIQQLTAQVIASQSLLDESRLGMEACDAEKRLLTRICLQTMNLTDNTILSPATRRVLTVLSQESESRAESDEDWALIEAYIIQSFRTLTAVHNLNSNAAIGGNRNADCR